jgi:hypothetical protein
MSVSIQNTTKKSDTTAIKIFLAHQRIDPTDLLPPAELQKLLINRLNRALFAI